MPNDADQARQLADLFASMSETVDNYRLQHFETLTPSQREDLEQTIQRLDDLHDEFTSAAIADTLNAIRSDLDQIAAVTTDAQQALKHLNDFATIVNIVAAATELGEDIATADYGAIPQAIKDIAQAIPQKSDKSSSGTEESTR